MAIALQLGKKLLLAGDALFALSDVLSGLLQVFQIIARSIGLLLGSRYVRDYWSSLEMDGRL